MKSFFSSQFFSGNRSKLAEAYEGKLPIVITGNGLLQRGNDSTYAFFQDANFWYLTGISEPDLILVIDKEESYIICPERSAARDAFDGKIDTDNMKKHSGVSAVYSEKTGWTKLKKRLDQSKKLTTILPPPDYIDVFGMYTNPARARVYEDLRRLTGKIYDATPELLKLRTVKQKPEIQAIQKAIDITGDTMSDVLSKKQLWGYSYEYEVEASIKSGFRYRGASGEAFDSIVAAGRNAATLHHFSGYDKISKKDLLLVDIGAEVEHYAADITRVYSLSKPSSRQLEIHAAVKDVQSYAISLLRPGVLLSAYEALVVDYLGEQLKALGIIKTTDEKTMRKAYPHRTSHFMGLNVHDSGQYDEPLRAGTVLTVEPGIYLEKESIGVRLEDDILITEKGAKVLSSKIPATL